MSESMCYITNTIINYSKKGGLLNIP
jgi:hypothetical protein